jgi:hypothetical protein
VSLGYFGLHNTLHTPPLTITKETKHPMVQEFACSWGINDTHECEFKAKDTSTLYTHIIHEHTSKTNHDPDKPYSCMLVLYTKSKSKPCMTHFKTREHLKSHLRSHLKFAPFHCAVSLLLLLPFRVLTNTEYCRNATSLLNGNTA